MAVAPKRLPDRRIRLEYPDDLDPAWCPPFPEFAAGCNSVSLIMPYAEPYFVKSVRSATGELDGALLTQTEEFLRQESQHHRQHRRFNDIIDTHYPRIPTVERWMKRTYGWLSDTRSQRFNLAFAAGSETIAFTLARWVDDNLDRLFAGADPLPATLFLWHLAEEVEHKTAAFDVWEAIDGKRRRYAFAMSLSFVILAWFTMIGSLTQLFHDGRGFYPMTYFRLLRWGLSYAWSALPTMLGSALPGHNPSAFTDPSWLTTWLREFDPETGTLPEPTFLSTL